MISFAWMEKEIIHRIEERIGKATGSSCSIGQLKPVGGGCINQSFKAITGSGNYFVKLNDASAYAGMFEAEAYGLEILRKANALYVPAVIASGVAQGKSFLVLEWIESGKKSKNFFEDFGRRLALLHNQTGKFYGLDKNNYIGSLVQLNTPTESFTDFFIQCRLEVQIRLAIDNGRLPAGFHSFCERLHSRLDEIIPPEKPALLHGDLWNGNYMTGTDGYACLIDPAVYYGHREADLAMTLLFGGFDSAFYESYHRHFPLERNWRKRMDIFNLYPLLVHVNLFGGGYAGEVMRIVKRF